MKTLPLLPVLAACTLSGAALSSNSATGTTGLPAGSQAFLSDLVAIGSGTGDPEGLQRMRSRIAGEFGSLGFRPTEITGSDGRKVLSLSFPGSSPELLFVGHIDTVFEKGAAPATLSFADGKARAPGVIDMKAGIVLMRDVLAALPDGEKRRVRVLLNDDEETGSKGTRGILIEEAKKASAALVFEPGLPDGSVVTSQSGIRWLEVKVKGRAAHAGLEPEKGLNACVDLAAKLTEFAALTDYRKWLTVNAGVIEGGTKPNVVCEKATTRLDIRYVDDADLERTLSRIGAIARVPKQRNALLALSTTTEVSELAAMPSLMEASTRRLFGIAKEVARREGYELAGRRVGYGSDANHLASTGIPLLVGVGPYGGGMHTDQEYLDVASYARRKSLVQGVVKNFLAGIEKGASK